MHACELPLIILHRFLDALDSLIHGVELIGGHDIATYLCVPALGVLGELGDLLSEAIQGVSDDLDLAVKILELGVLGLVLRGWGVLE